MITVHYFGGYRSTVNDVEAWRQSGQQQCPDVHWYANPYPPGATAGNPLGRWSRSGAIARRIKNTPNDTHILIGHSSGCAISNDIANYARMEGAKNWVLIALDGFLPSAILRAFPKTMVWSAKHGTTKSLNYESCSQAGDKFHVYEATCSKLWPLHFSLVNVNASDEYPAITDGYHACKANLTVFGNNLVPYVPPSLRPTEV